MHLEPGDAHEESGAAELFLFVVIAQDMADILAKKTLDALAEFLHSIDVALVHLPFHVGTRGEGRNLAVDFVLPRDICDQIFNYRERLHRLHSDWLIQGQRIHTRLAGQPWPAVHFRRARTALAGFTVPAHGQIGRLVSLYVVERVEHNHAGGDRDLVLDEFAGVAITAEDFECGVRHKKNSPRRHGDTELVNQSPNAVLQNYNVKVDEQTDLHSPEFQISKRLRFVYWSQSRYRFDFYDNGIRYEQIHA